MTNRRQVLAAAAALPILGCKTTPETPVNVIPRDMLQSGDLIFPRDPGAFVPYILGPDASEIADRRAWEDAKADLVQRSARNEIDLPPEQIRAFTGMSYEEFRSIYDGSNTHDPRLLGAGNLSVGHVAIVIVEGGTIDVVEAVWGEIAKVNRRPYAEFEAEHVDDSKWLARLKSKTAVDRESVAKQAISYVGVKYDFWNMDLSSEKGFYCSKLVWLAVWRSLKFAIDNNPNPKRLLWFSPKQLLRQPTLDVLIDPGPYFT